MNKRNFLLMGVVFFLLIFSFKVDAYSTEKYPDKVEERFIVSPVNFDLTLKPGQKMQEKLTVINRLGRKEKFFIKVESLVGDGQIEDPRVNSSIDWIKPDVDEFYLEQGERMNLDLNIDVPENLSPAGYYANILVISENSLDSSQGSAKVNIVSRIGVSFLATVPGKINREGELLDFYSNKFLYFMGPVEFYSLFINRGNIHLFPTGEIEIYNLLDKKIAEVPLEPRVVLPGGKKEWKITWNKKWLIGKYKAKLRVRYTDNPLHIIEKEIVFWAFPFHVLILIILAIHLVDLIIKKINERFTIVRRKNKLK